MPLPQPSSPFCLRALLLALGLAFAAAAGAQSPRWWTLADPVFYNHGMQQGLPPGAVWAVSQDREGFIWLATTGGLYRWNGHTAETVTTGIGHVDSDTRTIMRDGAGHLWFGTGSGLAVFDPATRTIQEVPLGFATGVLAIALENRSQTLWLGTEHGVMALDPQSGEVERYLDPDGEGLRVFDMLVEDAAVWAGTARGLFRRDDDGAFTAVDLGALPRDTRIATVLKTGSDGVWIGTPRDGVVRIGPDGSVAPVPIPDFENEWIYAAAEVRPGVIWLGTYGRGLIEIHGSGGLSRRMVHSRTLRYSLAHDEVSTIFVDDGGRAWVGTGRGVSLHDPSQQALLTVFGDSRRPGGVRDDQVSSLMADAGDRLWVGLEQNGVDILDPDRGRIGQLAVDPATPDRALPGGAVEAMAAYEGRFYVGSNWGLYAASPAGNEVERLRFEGRPADRYTGVLGSHLGALLAGGIDGLWRLDPASMTAEPVPASLNEAFTDRRITTVAEAPDGGLVVGTWDGLNRLDELGRLVDRVAGPGHPDSPFGNGYITSLLHDREGRLWVATSGAGLYIRTPTGWRWIGRGDGLPSESMAGMEIDDRGRIWAASSGGLAVIDARTFEVRALGPGDGAVIVPYVRQASATTAAGELVFGGDGGLTIVRPELWQASAPASLVAILHATAGGERVDHTLEGSESMPIVVPAERNEIAVEFAALDYTAPRAARYRYQMEGYDSRWRETDAEHRVASYTGLPPGDYRFIVEASDRRGVFDGKQRSLHITVEPLWYQTTIAWIAGAVGLVLLIALGTRLRTGQLRRRQARLESIVAERTRELEATTEALREKSAALEEASLTDALTGMHNRRFLDAQLPRDASAALRRCRDGQPGGDLLFFVLDVDHFKEVNDAHGHKAGDQVLTQMKPRLRRVFRDTDYLVRWGGEEFLVVAREADREQAAALAERIRTEVREDPFRVEDTGLSLTCSIGVAAFPFDRSDPESLSWEEVMELADHAMFTAKRASRDAWVIVRSGGEEAEAVELVSNIDSETVSAHWADSRQLS